MSWLDSFNDFETNNKYKPNIKSWQYFMKNRFNIQYDLKANTFTKGYFKLIREDKFEKEHENNHGNKLFSKYNYIVIFPEYGLRINCTKHFIDNVSLLKNMFNGKWNEQPYILHYYDINLKKVLDGPKIYVSKSELDIYVYTNNNINAQGEINMLDSILNCLKYSTY